MVKMKSRLQKIYTLRSRNRLKVSKFDFLPDLVLVRVGDEVQLRLGGVKIKTNSVQFHLKFPVWTELGKSKVSVFNKYVFFNLGVGGSL